MTKNLLLFNYNSSEIFCDFYADFLWSLFLAIKSVSALNKRLQSTNFNNKHHQKPDATFAKLLPERVAKNLLNSLPPESEQKVNRGHTKPILSIKPYFCYPGGKGSLKPPVTKCPICKSCSLNSRAEENFGQSGTFSTSSLHKARVCYDEAVVRKLLNETEALCCKMVNTFIILCCLYSTSE